MATKQEFAELQLRAYLAEAGLELIGDKEIDYGHQFRISNGTDVCSVNVYTSGKVVVGGKRTALRQQMEEWKNFQQAQSQMLDDQDQEHSAQSRSTKYIVSQANIDKTQ